MSELAIAFPLAIGPGGEALTTASPERATEQLIEELLFTAPGERVDRPDLGCGLLKLVFDPASDELRAATQFQIAADLQQWLSDVARIVAVAVSGAGSELDVMVTYQLAGQAATQTVAFRR